MTRAPKVTAAGTRDQLREELANHPTKTELREELAKVATKDDLATWAGALEHRFHLALQAQSADLAQHINAILAHARGEIAVLDDKDKDLPDRVTRLEAKATR